MNTLSGDDLLNVFQFLPGDDVFRFSRLNKSFVNWHQNHRRILPKPKITVALENSEGTEIKITTSKRSFVLIPDNDFHYVTGWPDELCNIFKDKREYELVMVLEWIFSIADVGALHLDYLGQENLSVMEAITNTKCRCFEIHLKFYYLYWTHFENMQSNFAKFCNHQRKLGVSLKLDATHSLRLYMSASSKIPFPIAYGELFEEVKFSHDKTSFFRFFEWACKEWEKGKLTAENAHFIRFRFYNVTQSLRAASCRLAILCHVIFGRRSPVLYSFSKFDINNVTEVLLNNHKEELKIQYKFDEETFFVTVQVVPC